ncbi:toll/interleukin-1 receptor domain-containing protein [Ancylobacter sp. FA202]|uniref:toll/interleukin-1 receptor domain-containing protein n=1 Tax=Ancylobacter sp. FA202 TaxID=1111106 RepID=UPI001FD9BD18|nr:toll/interleukin-1 receptor domain-containing protein [Ancylobacter sp. FA202]
MAVPSVFFSYSHADEALRDQLEKQLSILKRQGVITTWHDRKIDAGGRLHGEIDRHINLDAVILLLVSADFISSEYCYDIEMSRALEREAAGEAIVIPIILRACDWQNAPFGHLRATPRDGKPVTQWPDRDQAFLQVVQDIRQAVSRISSPSPAPAARSPVLKPPSAVRDTPVAAVRSSNLRLAKTFTQREKDAFLEDTFGYIARFFENSLAELTSRNPGFEGAYRRIDANRFFATIYKHGKDVAKATVFVGGSFGSNGIGYASGHMNSDSSFNEHLRVDADEHALFLKSMGMSIYSGQRESKLTQEGAAELYWGILIKPLQGNG